MCVCVCERERVSEGEEKEREWGEGGRERRKDEMVDRRKERETLIMN